MSSHLAAEEAPEAGPDITGPSTALDRQMAEAEVADLFVPPAPSGGLNSGVEYAGGEAAAAAREGVDMVYRYLAALAAAATGTAARRRRGRGRRPRRRGRGRGLGRAEGVGGLLQEVQIVLALGEPVLAGRGGAIATADAAVPHAVDRRVFVPAIHNLGEPVHACLEFGLLVPVGGRLGRAGDAAVRPRAPPRGGALGAVLGRPPPFRAAAAAAAARSPGVHTHAITFVARDVLVVDARLGGLRAVGTDRLNAIALDLPPATGVAGVRDAVPVDLTRLDVGSRTRSGFGGQVHRGGGGHGLAEAEGLGGGGGEAAEGVSGVHCGVSGGGVGGVSGPLIL